MDPRSARGYLALAFCFDAKGPANLEKAFQYAQKLIELAPSEETSIAVLPQFIKKKEIIRKLWRRSTKPSNCSANPTKRRPFTPIRIEGTCISDSAGMRRPSLTTTRPSNSGPFRSYSYKLRAATHFQLKNYAKALADSSKPATCYLRIRASFGGFPPEDLAKYAPEEFRRGLIGLAGRTIKTNPRMAEPIRIRADSHAAFGHRLRRRWTTRSLCCRWIGGYRRRHPFLVKAYLAYFAFLQPDRGKQDQALADLCQESFGPGQERPSAPGIPVAASRPRTRGTRFRSHSL